MWAEGMILPVRVSGLDGPSTARLAVCHGNLNGPQHNEPPATMLADCSSVIIETGHYRRHYSKTKEQPPKPLIHLRFVSKLFVRRINYSVVAAKRFRMNG